MPFDSLREFMAHLEARGTLVGVREPVSPVLEITEIHVRLLAGAGGDRQRRACENLDSEPAGDQDDAPRAASSTRPRTRSRWERRR